GNFNARFSILERSPPRERRELRGRCNDRGPCASAQDDRRGLDPAPAVPIENRDSKIENPLRFLETLRLAFAALTSNKLRSGLTVLGIAVGVFSVIGVMTLINGMRTSVETGLNVLG